ncbi:MAG: hypothetical protein KC910_36075 [Candidatus Eremiobacteraeota bacterium]|nr:hypothetical protein [Candidatus Eremiobacteraeota bacterium]
MRSILTRALSIFAMGLALAAGPATAEEMVVPTNTFKGKITFVKGEQAAVVYNNAYVIVTVNDSTWKQGLVERGAKATVVYRVGDNMALKIWTDHAEPPDEEEEAKPAKKGHKPRPKPSDEKATEAKETKETKEAPATDAATKESSEGDAPAEETK